MSTKKEAEQVHWWEILWAIWGAIWIAGRTIPPEESEDDQDTNQAVQNSSPLARENRFVNSLSDWSDRIFWGAVLVLTLVGCWHFYPNPKVQNLWHKAGLYAIVLVLMVFALTIIGTLLKDYRFQRKVKKPTTKPMTLAFDPD